MIHDLARKLAAALKESPENKAFQQAKQKVLADGKAEKLITEFRTRQFQLSALHMQGKQPDPAAVKELEKLAQELQSNPVTRAYLEAEARLGQLWSDIQTLIAQAVGMDVARK